MIMKLYTHYRASQNHIKVTLKMTAGEIPPNTLILNGGRGCGVLV